METFACRECKLPTRIKSSSVIERLSGEPVDTVVKLETGCGHVYTATVFAEDWRRFEGFHESPFKSTPSQ